MKAVSAMVKTDIKGSASIWDALDLGFEETQSLRLKSQLLMALSEKIALEFTERGLSQGRLAKAYKLSQPTLSWIVTGKINRFSVASLLKIASRFGLKIEMTIT